MACPCSWRVVGITARRRLSAPACSGYVALDGERAVCFWLLVFWNVSLTVQEILQASGHGKNLTRVAVEEKISSLRGDEEARNDFDDYVRAMTRNRTTEDIVERNVSLISNATPAEWISAAQEHLRDLVCN